MKIVKIGAWHNYFACEIQTRLGVPQTVARRSAEQLLVSMFGEQMLNDHRDRKARKSNAATAGLPLVN